MCVPHLDCSANMMEQKAFNVDAHMTVVQTNQELRNAQSNCKSSKSITSKEKIVKATTGWIPKPGKLIREKIPNKDAFGPA